MTYFNKLKNTRGFTLIELLVVIAIIGILSSVVLASLNGARADARDSRRVQDLAQIRTAVELCANENGTYENCDGNEGELSEWLQTYPTDPSTDGVEYPMETDQTGYCIWVETDNWEGDAESIPDNDTGCGGDYSVGPDTGN